MIKNIFSLLLLVVHFHSIAQDLDSALKSDKSVKYDTSRIVDISDKLAVYFNVAGKIHSIDIGNASTDRELHIVPNGQSTLGFGLDYKWIGLSTSFSLPFMSKDEQNYGKTERLDIQVNYYNNSFGIDAYLKYYKGFYLENPEDFMDWPLPKFPLLAGMETFSVGLSGYYFFNNKKFSYKAAFPRTMVQKKSSGSFILGGYLSRNVAIAPEGVLPEELPDSLSAIFDIDGFATTMMGVSFGYTYTWVIYKKFFANISLVPGFGYAKPEISTSMEDKKFEPGISASVTSRISLGYEGKHFYSGFNLVSIVDNFSYETIDVSSTTGNIRFFIGRRFDLSKFFKNKKQ